MRFRLIDHLTDKQVEELHALYQQEWWTNQRRLEDVRRMLAGTGVIIALEDSETGGLVAFARVLTDNVYRAHLFDVIVRDSQRGQGLGKALMEAVLNHPVVGKVEKIILSCRTELVPFYERWGFTTELGPDIHVMVRPGPAGLS